MVFLFVFSFWDSYDSSVGAFNIVPEVSEIVLISFNSFFWAPKSLQMVIAAMKLKDAFSLEGKL